MREWLHERYRTRTSAPVEKSRDSGLTYIACAFSVWLWIFVPGVQIGWGSRKEMLVHRAGDQASIFEKIKSIIENLPPFLLPEGFKADADLNYMKFVNRETGAAITGEAGGNIGRGGRCTLYFIDEAAFLKALETGKVSAAGLDVIDGEWMEDKTQHPLIRYARDHDNLVITPHIGGATILSIADARIFIVKKLVRYLKESVLKDT